MKKIFSIFLAIAMLVTTCAVSAAHYTDIDGHWAQEEIEDWSNYGVISGYNGEFSPNQYITRGEFAVVLSRLMGYQKESQNIFDDLPEKFYTSHVLKLFEAGVMQGYESSIRPDASLTREEASVIICRALGINTAEVMNKDFADITDVSSWAKGYINAMVNTGLLNGADGKLNPKNPITRAEVVKILDNAVYPILKSGTFEKVNTDKILVVSAGDVTVKDSEIEGKVIITQGVNDGKLSFRDSDIKNDIVFDNDRSAFIETKNTTVSNESILKHKAFITEKTGITIGKMASGGGSGGGSSAGGSTTGGTTTGDGETGGSTTGGTTGDEEPDENEPAEDTYTVTFIVNGQIYSTIEVTEGTAIGMQLPEEPHISGRIFLGWKNIATDVYVTENTVVTGPMNVKAIWAYPSGGGGSAGGGSWGEDDGGSSGCGAATMYAVRFIAKDTIIETIYVRASRAIEDKMPEDLVIEGFIFKGWKDVETGEQITEETVVRKATFVEAVLERIDGNGSCIDEHSWNEGIMIVHGYCTASSVKVYTCTVCDENKIEIIAAPGHEFDEWEYLDERYHTSECARCGEPFEYWHNFDEYEVVLEPTHTEEGVGAYICTECGGREIEGIPALEHDYEYVQIDAENHRVECECGDAFVDSHFWYAGVVTVPATHLTTGVKTHRCICGATSETVIPTTSNHTYSDWVTDGDINHKKECACGDIVTKAHIWNTGIVTKEPTVTEEGIKTYTCTTCGHEKTEVIKKLPDPATTTTLTVGSVSAEKGSEISIPVSITNNYDGLCGLTLVFRYDEDVLAYMGATKGEALPDLDLTVPGPNFTEGNLTFLWDGIESDSTNGEIVVLTFKIKDTALNGDHAFDVIVKDACDYDVNDVVTIAVAGKVTVLAHEHEYGDWESDDEETHKRECSCGKVVTEIHSWDAGVVTKEPTVAETGIRTYTCTTCGHEKTEIIKKLPDPATTTTLTVGSISAVKGSEITVPVILSNNNNGAIDSPGLTGLTLNVTYDANTFSYISATKGEALPDLDLTKPGPNFIEGNVVFNWDGICADSTNGEILLITFEVAEETVTGEYAIDLLVKTACDYNIEDIETIVVAGKVNVTDLIKPPHEHEYGEWEKEDEVEHKKVCACGDVIKEEHVWDNGVMNQMPSCDSFGIETYTCLKCSETSIIEYWPAEHTWDAGVVTKEPTVTKEGIMTYTCSVCNETKTEAIEKLPDPNAPTVAVGDVRASAGDEITVPVVLTNSVGLTGLVISIGYDADVLALVGAKKGDALTDLTFTKPGNFIANPINFLWDGTDGDYTNGTVMLLTFRVADDAKSGDYRIDMTVISACDADVEDIDMTAVDGIFSVVD